MSKFKGQIELPNGMIMVMDYNALADVEEQTGIPALDIIGMIDEGKAKITHIRAFYWAALKRHQEITIEEAGDVFSEYPSALGECIMAASPQSSETKPGNAKRAVRK